MLAALLSWLAVVGIIHIHIVLIATVCRVRINSLAVVLRILGSVISALGTGCARRRSWRHAWSSGWRLLAAITTIARISAIALTPVTIAIVIIAPATTVIVVSIVRAGWATLFERFILLFNIIEKVEAKFFRTLDFVWIRATMKM